MPQIGNYTVDTSKRRLLTPQNLVELGITSDMVQSILSAKLPALQRIAMDKDRRPLLDEKRQQMQIWPDGLSFNETTFGNYPGPTAAEQGWMAYLEIGAPLIEERANIIQPPVDVLSTRAYENRATGGGEKQFSDTVNFSIENTISWSLEGTSEFTFEGSISGQLKAQFATSLRESLALSKAELTRHTDIAHNHKDEIGSEEHDATQTTTTTTTTSTQTNTATGTATGTGELSAQLMLGITGSVSGTLTTSWGSSSQVSGTIPSGSRVETMATQRRQVKQYTYELPITFAGFVGLHYPELVLPFGDANNPQPTSIPPTDVVARDISSLGLIKPNQRYWAKGVAETVSTLDVNHVIFENKSIPSDGSQTFGTKRPHNL